MFRFVMVALLFTAFERPVLARDGASRPVVAKRQCEEANGADDSTGRREDIAGTCAASSMPSLGG
jgi:hypothetical protein